MITHSKLAAEKLKEMLTVKCTDLGIGFRLAQREEENGEKTFKLKLDSQKDQDQVVVVDGIKLFINAFDSLLLDDYRLDYRYKSGTNEGDFILVISNAAHTR